MLVWLAEYTGGETIVGQLLARAGLAAALGLALTLLFGSRTIGWLRTRFREPNASDSPRLRQLHQHKHSTPTMGGLFIVAGIFTAAALATDWRNSYLLPALFLTAGLTALGAIDDLRKISRRSNGVRAKTKLAIQCILCTATALWLFGSNRQVSAASSLQLPLLSTSIELGWWFLPLAALVMVGSSNAVNLTDGLDGLASGCLLPATAAIGLLALVCGDPLWAAKVGVAHLPGVGELGVVAAAMLGAVLGFLRFNRHPARVFMGDTGSLPLGGLLGFFAVAARQELLLLMIGAVFVVEAASVIVQVAWFRRTGRRVFRCAPLHHHFQFLGWPERRIVARFWFAAALCALLGVASLGLNRPSPARPANSADSLAARARPR